MGAYHPGVAAAFDTVDHSTLTSCLSSWLEVYGIAEHWFVSYLANHYQAINVNFALSDRFKVFYSVPQGSVLVLICCPGYTTPLSRVTQKHNDIKFYYYTDDTKMTLKFYNYTD